MVKLWSCLNYWISLCLPHGPHNLPIIGTVKHVSYEGYVVLDLIRIIVNDQNIMYTTNGYEITIWAN